MPDIQFPDASPYNPNVKFGERPSAFDFVPNQYWSGIRAGSVTADLTGWIQDGLYSLGGVGGGIFYMPWGVYPVKDIDCPAGVEIVGDGKRRTFLKRMATLPPGRGVLNFAGDGSAVRKLAIDGMVTVPVGYTYAELVDPMEYKLTVDTSIWIHSGASNITVAQTLVYHSGGYAVLVDATTGDVRRVLLEDDDFENNRPNTAGMPGDTTAGGWGGGVHYQGDGFLYSVSGLHVDKSRFRRGAGNQLWGHLYGFSKLHSDIKATGCHFTDIGRDGIMLGGVSGGVVSDCHFRRIGYVCTDDTSPIGTPKWVSNQWAVALDTAGLVRGVNYTNNTFLNCLGACMDGDGYAEGTVSGNICRVSKPDEPEYAEDNVAAWPSNPEKPSASYCYGFQTSNSNAIDWSARGVNITGNYFYNLGLGAIRLYSARKCSAWGNTIWHPDESLAVPILLGNIGNGDNQRAQDNSIGENTVHWNPAGQNPVVFEDPNSFPFAATDKNWIAGNRLFGTGMYEFRKDAGTASITGRVYSSNADGLTIPSENYLQRESGYLRMYGGTDVLFTLLDRHAISEIGAGVTGGPLFNVSLNGAGGVISTGGRTVIPIDDCVATAVLASDSFLSMTQKFISGSFVYEDAKANLFDANFGLMRYNPTAKKFQISTAGGAAAGARVWTDLGAGSGPAAPDQSVQWNDGGIFGGSADLVFNRTSKLLLATTAIATGARSSLPTTDIIATGILYGDTFLSITNTTFDDLKANLLDATYGLIRYDSTARKFQVSTSVTGSPAVRVWANMGPADPDQSVQWNDGGVFGGSADLVFNRTSKLLLAASAIATGTRSALSLTDIMATGVLYGDCFLSITNTTFDDAKANLLNDNWGLIRYDRTVKKFQLSTSVSGAPPVRVWVDLNTGGTATVPGAPLQSVQFNDGGAFAGNANLLFNKTSNLLLSVVAIATGTRTALPFGDTMATAVLAADSFVSFTDTTFTPDGNTKANLLPATYGLLRYIGPQQKFQVSTSVNGAVRVWTDLYTGAPLLPGGVTNSVQYKTATGTFGGDAYIKWDPVARVLTVEGDTNNAPSIHSSYGWIQSEHGFYSPMPVSDNVVNVPNGGVYSRNLISVRDDEGPSLKLARTIALGGQSADFQWRIDTLGAMVLKDSKNALDRMTLAQNGIFSFSGGDTNFVNISGVSGFVNASTSVTAPLIRATVGNDTAIQATAGGIQVKSGAQVGQGLYLKAYPDPLTGLNPPPTTEFGVAATFGGLAYKGGTQYRVWIGSSWATVDFATVGGGVTTITGKANQIIASNPTGAVALSLPQDIHTGAAPSFNTLYLAATCYFFNSGGDPTNQFYINAASNQLRIICYSPSSTTAGTGFIIYTALAGAGISGRYSIDPSGVHTFDGQPYDSGAVIRCTGYIQAATGFYTGSGNDQAIQAPSGGVWANKLTTQLGLFSRSQGAPNWTVPNGYGGFVHQTGTTWWVNPGNTSTWTAVNLALVGGGVTSITGTPNQVIVNQNTGAVTLSLPQAIHTAAAPTFDTLYLQYLFMQEVGTPGRYWRINAAAGNLYFVSAGVVNGQGAGYIWMCTKADGTQGNRMALGAEGKLWVTPNGDFNPDPWGAMLHVKGITWSQGSIRTDEGISANSTISTVSGFMAGRNATTPGWTPGGYGGLVHKSGTTWWLGYDGTWVAANLGGGAPYGGDGSVQFTQSGGFMADGNIFWDNTGKGLRLGNFLHGNNPRLTSKGKSYFGGSLSDAGSAVDFVCLYQYGRYETALQTCIDNVSIETNPTTPAYFFYNKLRLQPMIGRVVIGSGANDWQGTLDVNGNCYIVNSAYQAANPALLVRGASGQTGVLQRWEAVDGTILMAADTGGNFHGQAFCSQYNGAASGGASPGESKYLGREIRFTHLAPDVHEFDSGTISFRTLDATCLALVGYGTTNVNRVVKAFDDFIVIRNAYVNGSLGSGTLYSSQLDLLKEANPGVSVGNQARLWTDGAALWASVSGSAPVNLLLAGSGGGGTPIPTDPTFNTVTAAGVIKSTGINATITFQSAGGTFQVNGYGQISGLEVNTTQGYKVGGNVIVDVDRNCTFVQVNSSRLRQFGERTYNAVHSDGGMNALSYNTHAAGGLQFFGVEDEDIEIPGGFMTRGGLRTKFQVRGGIVVNIS